MSRDSDRREFDSPELHHLHERQDKPWCIDCKGAGGFERGDHEDWDECQRCKGTGMMPKPRKKVKA